jgi:hypothetical protein
MAENVKARQSADPENMQPLAEAIINQMMAWQNEAYETSAKLAEEYPEGGFSVTDLVASIRGLKQAQRASAPERGQLRTGIAEGLRRAAELIDTHTIMYGCPGSAEIVRRSEGCMSSDEKMWADFLRQKAVEHDILNEPDVPGGATA